MKSDYIVAERCFLLKVSATQKAKWTIMTKCEMND